MAKPRCAIFDIDGTLANCDHRRHLVDLKNYPSDLNERADWDEFKRRAKDDPPIPSVVELAQTLHTAGYSIVCCTGRGSDQYEMTREWLTQWGIPFDALLMRDSGDFRADAIVKRELLATIRESYNVWIVVDDRQSVVDMWREEGLTCLQCAPGDF